MRPLERRPAPGAPNRHDYVTRVIEAYRRTPGTLGHVRRSDRRCALALHQRGIRLQLVEAAFQLAALRRAHRDADAPPLGPIRSLQYFVPLVDELVQIQPSALYFSLLAKAMAELERESRRTDT